MVEEQPPKIEELTEEEENEEVAEEAGAEGEGEEGAGKHSKAEKKARKHLQKLGLKQVEGITRVTLRKGKNILMKIQAPEVHKSPVSDTYVVFGEVKFDDLSQQAQASAAEQFKAPAAAVEQPKAEAVPEKAAEVEEEEEGEVDESGLDTKDIDLIMSQTGVSRGKAAKALRAHGDVVNAIMNLT